MEQIKFNYSLKNIGLSTNDDYKRKIIQRHPTNEMAESSFFPAPTKYHNTKKKITVSK